MASNRKPDPYMIDEDNPALTKEQIAKMRPGKEVFAELGMKAPRSPGRPKTDNPKVPVTIRLDADLLEKMKGTGKGWQTRASEALKKHFA